MRNYGIIALAVIIGADKLEDASWPDCLGTFFASIIMVLNYSKEIINSPKDIASSSRQGTQGAKNDLKNLAYTFIKLVIGYKMSYQMKMFDMVFGVKA